MARIRWMRLLLGTMLVWGIIPLSDGAEGGLFESALKRARQGDAKAQSDLGSYYLYGLGVDKDFAEAAKWLRKAADQGDRAAQSELGSLFEQGQGVKQDHAEAVKWYRKAADKGHSSAQTSMGYMCLHGMGVERDLAESAAWFRKAADAIEKTMTEAEIVSGKTRLQELLPKQTP